MEHKEVSRLAASFATWCTTVQIIESESVVEAEAAERAQAEDQVDDLREALLRDSFDVIHFSGHGCVDAPLQRMLRHAQVVERRRRLHVERVGVGW